MMHFACECFQELARSCRRKLEEMEERERKKKEKADKVATQSKFFQKLIVLRFQQLNFLDCC